MADAPSFRYIGKRRRAVEHRRFVVGQGRYAADVQPLGLLHVAIVASPHASARIVSVDASAALAVPGVHAVLTGEEMQPEVDAMLPGVDAPEVKRFSMARGVVRYAGEWVVAVVAETRAVAEDASELVEVEYEQTPHVIDPEEAIRPGAPLVHPAHGSNVIFRREFVWGPVEEDFAAAGHTLSYRARWARSATVPIETFVATCAWNDATGILDTWASIQIPKFPDQLAKCLRLPGNSVRVHFDVDVGGSYGTKRGLKHAVLVGYLARKLGRPVRFLEDRLENMRGGDMQGPDRIFDVTLAFEGDGTVRAMKMRAVAAAPYAELVQRREALRAEGKLAGIGVSTCLEPSGGNSSFELLFNPKNNTTTWMDSCLVRVDLNAAVTAVMSTSTSGQAHETLVSTVVGEVLQLEPDTVRVLHADSLHALPSNSPVGSRMAIMLGGAAAGAAKRIRTKLIRIAAHNLGVAEDALGWQDGSAFVEADPSRRLPWARLVEIAHREFHNLPEGMEPGLQEKFVWQVPTGGMLATPDGRIQISPCYSFEAHVVLASLDPETGKAALHRYLVGHDCGVVINPDVVHGMTCGGVAHAVGAALMEKFAFSPEGQLLSGSFMDYLLPSAQEVPAIAVVDHCTPSPLTEFGQKGSGEAGYLGGPAAIASAINDALVPAGASIDALPMTPAAIWRALRAAARAAAGAGARAGLKDENR